MFLSLWVITVQATDELSMFVGEIQIIEVGNIDRVAVGKGDLLSTSMLDNGQLLILAEKEGETTVHIWYADGAESDIKVQVLTADTNRVINELQTLLSDLPYVKVKQVGQKLFITGSIECTAGQEECDDQEMINTILAAYPDVINLTRVAQLHTPLILPSNKMVSMDVKITEFNTAKLSELGINWSDAIAGPGAAYAQTWIHNEKFSFDVNEDFAPAFTPIDGVQFSSPLGAFGIATSIVSVINLLQQTGDAIILAEPRLSARSGGQAEFLAGGEIPVVTTGGLGSTNVEFKEFGIILNINPVVDAENNIMATVATEVSAVDQANAVGGVPAFITRKTSTDVSMQDGDTLVLSGLIDRSIGEQIDKFPFLGDIPILGHLFKSTRWNNDLTELVIFVTPTVFDAKSDYNKKQVNRRQELFDGFKQRVDGRKNKQRLDNDELILDILD